MTTQTAVLAAPTGLTLTAKLFTLAAPDTTAFTADSVTERTNAKGQYVASFGEASAISGDYTLILFSGTRPVAIGYRTFAGTDAEIATETPPTVELDSASLRAALGMSAADLDDQLDAILAAASAGAGTGARTVTITVNDGTTALQNAVVRFTEGSNTFRALTNASGVATFNLDDATYTVAVTKSGYTYAGTTMVVNGTETATYSMTVVSISPPDGPTKTVLTILCLDENGDADSGVNVSIRYVTIPTDSVDIAFPGASITKTSNGSGIATFQVIKGATIEYKRGTRDVWLEATMSDEDTTSITSFIGTP